MVNCAEPSVLALRVDARHPLPISVKSFGSFSVTCAGGGSAAAFDASSPKVARRPDAGMRHHAARDGDLRRRDLPLAAAAATSIARAVAPAWRSCSHEFAIAVLPPVPCTGPKEVVVALWRRRARPRRAPAPSRRRAPRRGSSRARCTCPGRTRCACETVTVLSGAMRTNAFGASAAAAAAAARRAGGVNADHGRAGSRRAVQDAALAEGSGGQRASHGQPSRRLRGLVNGGADARVGGAAADVAGHGGVDVGVRRPGRLRQQRDRRHDLAGLTVAALRHVQSRQAPCTASATGPDTPSMVTMARWTAPSGMTQARTGWPSR